jgi:hypothetical protein
VNYRRRRTAGALGAVAALAILAAGCGSGVPGQGQAAATPTTSTSQTTESSEETSETTETTEYTEPTEDTETTSSSEWTDETTTDTSVAELDQDTIYFFQASCGGATAFQQYAQPDTTGLTLAELQATAVEAYTNLSNSATDTAFLLEQLAVPNIENGQALYDNTIERFRVLGAVYGNGAATIEALTAPTEEDLNAAVQSIEKEAVEMSPETVDIENPAVRAAVQEIPECQPLF